MTEQAPGGSPPEQPGERISVVIADDHSSVRAGLQLILRMAEDIDVVAEASDGAGAVELARRLGPDVVLMDARMPGVDGVEATRRIRSSTGCAVLMLTTFDEDEIVFGAIRAGASGFLLKTVEPTDFVRAIRQVSAGAGAIAPEVTSRLLRRLRDGAVTDGPSRESTGSADGTDGPSAGGPPSRAFDHLTDREREVLASLGRGMSNAQIAGELFISLGTVKTHVSNVLQKLQVDSRMQAAYAARTYARALDGRPPSGDDGIEHDVTELHGTARDGPAWDGPGHEESEH